MSNDFLNGKITPEAADLLKTKGIDPNLLKSGSQDKILSSLSKSDADKINSILKDKESLSAFLSSDSAKEIMAKLFGGGK